MRWTPYSARLLKHSSHILRTLDHPWPLRPPDFQGWSRGAGANIVDSSYDTIIRGPSDNRGPNYRPSPWSQPPISSCILDRYPIEYFLPGDAGQPLTYSLIIANRVARSFSESFTRRLFPILGSLLVDQGQT